MQWQRDCLCALLQDRGGGPDAYTCGAIVRLLRRSKGIADETSAVQPYEPTFEQYVAATATKHRPGGDWRSNNNNQPSSLSAAARPEFECERGHTAEDQVWLWSRCAPPGTSVAGLGVGPMWVEYQCKQQPDMWVNLVTRRVYRCVLLNRRTTPMVQCTRRAVGRLATPLPLQDLLGARAVAADAAAPVKYGAVFWPLMQDQHMIEIERVCIALRQVQPLVASQANQTKQTNNVKVT